MKRLLLIITILLIAFSGYSQCWRVLQSGGNHVVAIHTDGTLWAWGNNSEGTVGDGTINQRAEPVMISPDTNWVSIAAGHNHSLALKADGTIWTWGSNFQNALGLNSNEQYITIPAQIGTATNWASIAAGHSTSFAIKKDGTLWGWGNNLLGQIGNGNSQPVREPVMVTSANDWKTIIGGDDFTAAIKKDGTLWTWGSGVPKQLGTDADWASASTGSQYGLAIKTNGTLWAWGVNSSGQFGNGTFDSSSTPIQIGTDTDWKQAVAAFMNSYFIKNNGTLWSCGSKFRGMLGNGTTAVVNNNDAYSAVITQVGTDADWVTVSSQLYQVIALKKNNAGWGWGSNYFGQLGVGKIDADTSYLNPVQVICPCGNGTRPDFVLNIDICPGSVTPVLATTSPNGISGTWNPAIVDITQSGEYTFTPDADKFPCAEKVIASVNVTPLQVVVFNNLPTTACEGSTVLLPQLSDNKFSGTWTPAIVNTATPGSADYTFTPNGGHCAITTPLTISITTIAIATPDFDAIAPVCLNGEVPDLETVSPNGIAGVWSPSVISNKASASYTFTPSGTGCFATQTLNVTIIQPLEPDFKNIELCTGATTVLENTSPNGVKGTWNPPSINKNATGQYTFTPLPGQCATPKTITVSMRNENDNYFTYKVGTIGDPTITAIIQNKGNYLFRIDGGEFQTGNVFTGLSSGLHVLEITDLDNCNYIYVFDNILILNYPNYFTPNGDGNHDYWNIPDLKPYPHNITIYDRYGKLITRLHNAKQGWDGTLNGKPLPAADYWFQVDYKKYEESKAVSFRAHFSLVR